MGGDRGQSGEGGWGKSALKGLVVWLRKAGGVREVWGVWLVRGGMAYIDT